MRKKNSNNKKITRRKGDPSTKIIIIPPSFKLYIFFISFFFLNILKSYGCEILSFKNNLGSAKALDQCTSYILIHYVRQFV
jgi:hypothetical protein